VPPAIRPRGRKEALLSSYRATLARPGARTLAIACALAWLTTSTYGLGLVLAVHHATGSFAAAGSTAGAFALGTALLAPWRGRLGDRRGPRMLRPLAVAHALLLAALLVTAGEVPAVGTAGAAVLAGGVVPPLIAVARTRWTQLAASPEQARPGHALNAVLADTSAVLGPVAVAALAMLTGPGLAVALFLPGLLTAAGLLSREHPHGAATATAGSPAGAGADPDAAADANPDPGARPGRVPRGIPGGAGFRMILATETLLAVAFGAFDLTAPAIGAAAGTPSLGAIALAGFAGGSAAAGLWSGAVTDAAPPARRLLLGLLVTTSAFAAASAAPSVLMLAAAAVPAGAGVGLAFVAILELLDAVVPQERSVEAFTWLTAGGGLGAAAGAVVAGQLIAGGHDAAAVALCAIAVGVAAAWAAIAPRPQGARSDHREGDQRAAATSSSVG
jgi:MFS family permease